MGSPALFRLTRNGPSSLVWSHFRRDGPIHCPPQLPCQDSPRGGADYSVRPCHGDRLYVALFAVFRCAFHLAYSSAVTGSRRDLGSGDPLCRSMFSPPAWQTRIPTAAGIRKIGRAVSLCGTAEPRLQSGPLPACSFRDRVCCVICRSGSVSLAKSSFGAGPALSAHRRFYFTSTICWMY